MTTRSVVKWIPPPGWYMVEEGASGMLKVMLLRERELRFQNAHYTGQNRRKLSQVLVLRRSMYRLHRKNFFRLKRTKLTENLRAKISKISCPRGPPSIPSENWS